MDDQNYQYGEVVTHDDLHSIYEGFKWQLARVKWYQLKHRIMLKIAINVIDNLHIWLHQGKPAVQSVSIPQNGGYREN